ncbi:ATP-dependent_RNA helicase [Hexamita inflata]|uniref:ATP-dependent RNA helicase n=1 Tax=Hexamita inflata TaxID=28002 RepID=A0AA86QBM3_9EUKA|nr:ATP-dependent RNA helicase [Hexamita inflata]
MKQQTSWSELGLQNNIVTALQSNKYQNPTDVQSLLLSKIRDSSASIICEAPDGAGKTIASIIAAIQKIDVKQLQIQAIIMVNNENHLQQFLSPVQKLCQALSIKYDVCIGLVDGYTIKLDKHLIIGTVDGILQNFVSKTVLGTNHFTPNSLINVKLLVIHDADLFFQQSQMKENVQLVIQSVNQQTQKILFSYVLDSDTQIKMKQKWFQGKEVTSIKQTLTLKNTFHLYFDAKGKGDTAKIGMLEKILSVFYFRPNFKCVVYCRAQTSVNAVCKKLKENDFAHSKVDLDTTQINSRTQYQAFQEDKTKIYVTNTQTFKINVPLSYVIMYDMPQIATPINYIQKTQHSTSNLACITINMINNDTEKKALDTISAYCQSNLKLQNMFTEVTVATIEAEVSKRLK